MAADVGIDSLPDLDGTTIVVGHDGSGHADEAVREAFEMASALGEPLLVVRAFSTMTAPRPEDVEFGYHPTIDELKDEVDKVLAAALADRAAQHPQVALSSRGVHGDPAKALLRLSESARLLVVGSRGRGGVAAMLLGSVSDQCVRESRCPVLVARRRDAR